MSLFAAALARTSAAAAARCCRRGISTTRILLEKKTVMVPTMGDSITEGTIVEWAVQIGQAVKTDDVIALVETDKVTVEIKAVVDGVLTQQFGAVDETVEVGGRLYEIDTDGVASVESASATETAAPTQGSPADQAVAAEADPPQSTNVSTTAPSTSHSSASSAARSHSIHFLGKDGWAERKSGQPATTQQTQQPAAPTKPHGVTVIEDDSVRHPMYGRPPFTEEEMEALVWGGANLVADWKIKN